jgi:VanZ family protein
MAWAHYLWHVIPRHQSAHAQSPRKDVILRGLLERPVSAGRHKIFISYVALMVLVFLAPVPAIPLVESPHVDKLVHFGVFLGFALLLYMDRPSRIGWTLLISLAFAAGIELVQWVLPYREGDWWDFVAGAAGASVGAVLMLLIEQQARRVAARSPKSSADSARSDRRAEERG